MCILLELFNFRKHLYSPAHSAFGAGTDYNLRGQIRGLTPRWPTPAGRLRQPGVAGEQVEPGPQRSPPHVPGGTCLGGSSLGQLSIISDSPAAFVIDS